MNVFEYGDKAGIPLVLFGGTPQKGDALADMDALASEANIRLICPTRPWYDTRDIAPSFDAVTKPVLDYLRDHGMSWVHVMGGSGGGPFAFHMAKSAPEKVATCTLLASMGLPGIFSELVTSPPSIELLNAFMPRDYGAWMETTRRWGLAPDLGHGAWGDFVVYFDELAHMDLEVARPVIVHQSASDPNAPLKSVEAMVKQCRSVSWRISEGAGHLAMANDPTGRIMRDIFASIASGNAT